MADGFALRQNGSCPAQQMDCGITVAPFRVCCPTGSFCPPQYNTNCCATEANCTASLVKDPQCANPGWDLYDNNGYFCCEPGFTGYATPGNTDGCARPGYSFRSGEQLLSIISSGRASATSGPSSTSSTVAPASASTTSAAGSSPEVGLTRSAKVGLGIGLGLGVPLLIAAALVGALLLRKRSRRSKDQELDASERQRQKSGVLSMRDLKGGARPLHEAPVSHEVLEAPSSPRRHEAPDTSALHEAPDISGSQENTGRYRYR